MFESFLFSRFGRQSAAFSSVSQHALSRNRTLSVERSVLTLRSVLYARHKREAGMLNELDLLFIFFENFKVLQRNSNMCY